MVSSKLFLKFRIILLETKEKIFKHVLDFYLKSKDCNGCPVQQLKDDTGYNKGVISELIKEEKLLANYGDRHPNPHILALEAEPINDQLNKIDTGLFAYACLYPTRKALSRAIPKSYQIDRPFSRLLWLGEPQLSFRMFDLGILEMYRNDPRYYYKVTETSGHISIRGEYYDSLEIRVGDQILLNSFGFGYSDDLSTRIVAVFLRYLADLTPEHQQIWKAKELIGNYFAHPDYVDNNIYGRWTDTISVFTAVLWEIHEINLLAAKLGREPLFKNEFRGEENRPLEYTFLVRPTLREYGHFVLTLDKMISDNINRTFFKNENGFKIKKSNDIGKVDQDKKGTIQLLNDWLRAYYDAGEAEPLVKRMILTFKKIRKERQPAAHLIEKDKFDMNLLSRQRELMKELFYAMQILRTILSSHPNAQGYKAPAILESDKIRLY
jgi:hypothetical protein